MVWGGETGQGVARRCDKDLSRWDRETRQGWEGDNVYNKEGKKRSMRGSLWCIYFLFIIIGWKRVMTIFFVFSWSYFPLSHPLYTSIFCFIFLLYSPSSLSCLVFPLFSHLPFSLFPGFPPVISCLLSLSLSLSLLPCVSSSTSHLSCGSDRPLKWYRCEAGSHIQVWGRSTYTGLRQIYRCRCEAGEVGHGWEREKKKEIERAEDVF